MRRLTIDNGSASATVLLGLALTLAACHNRQQLLARDIRPIITGTDPVLHGLREALKLTSTTDQPVRVLAVHGMLTSQPNFSFKWQSQITKKLALVFVDSTVVPIERGYTFQVFDGALEFPELIPKRSELRVVRWADPVDKSKIRLVFYEYLWAPFRDEVKNWFLACFELERIGSAHCPPTSAQPNRDPRAFANGRIKDKLLVQGLSDAAIVLSPLADVLRDDTDLALCLVAKDILIARSRRDAAADLSCSFAETAATSIAPARAEEISQELRATSLFALTHSLGGFFILDGQRRARERQSTATNGARILPQRWIPYAMLDTATVFMMANQISLLELGRLSVRCERVSFGRPCQTRHATDSVDRVQPARDTLKPRYVGLNDHDDILDLEIPPTLARDPLFGTLVNVSVRNRCPKLFFVLREPGCAHVDYYLNPAVLQAIIDGFRLDGQGLQR